MFNAVARWWAHRKQTEAHLRQQRADDIRDELGFIDSRPLNVHDTVTCCEWVLANCRHSLRTPKGKGTRIIVEEKLADSREILNRALADGLTIADDWATHRMPPLRFECDSERVLYKLTWG